jgi:3-oxoacyl-[acyl-carrier protein] reductase
MLSESPKEMRNSEGREDRMTLKDRVVLITGAGRGIGRAFAQAFAAEGARIGLQGKTKKNLLDVQKELKDFGAPSVVLPGDVSDEGAVSRAVAAAEQELGPIDVLVNNAGIFASGPIDKFDTMVFDRILAVNLRGPFLMARAILPGMKSRGRGHIVNVSSTAGKRGFAGGGPYCASKFGLAGLSEAMMYEARTSNVRVTCIFPSTVYTDLTKRSGMDVKPERAIQPKDVADAVVALVKMEDRAMPTSLEIWQTNP